MGVFNVVTLSAELAVLLWYGLAPVAKDRSDLVRDDLRAALHPKQSLAAMAGLSLLRLAIFTYTRHSSKRAPATRLFVFFVFLFEAVLCALSCLQPVIYWQDAQSFKRYRTLQWGDTYVYTLLALSLLSAVLQFGYILQLNHSRGRLADASLMRDVLGERADLLADSALQHDDVKLALWRTKWAQLVKQFKKKQTDPTFDAIVRLYAHRDGALERLASAYDRNPVAFEFYLPQLCAFLLHGAFVQSPQLCVILLDKCARSHVLAHKVLWYLEAYGVSASLASSVDESTQRVQMLIDEVADRGAVATRAIESMTASMAAGHDIRNDSQQQQQQGEVGDADRHARLACAPHEVEALLSQRDDDDHYSTFQDLERGAVPDPFAQETTFLTALANLSSNLRAVAFSERNAMLRLWLNDIQTQFLPSNSLYLPVGDPFHRLKRIHVSESFTFSTRERVPFLLCAEVVGYASPLEPKKAAPRMRAFLGARRFTLGLWDATHSQSDLLHDKDRPTPLVSPDAAKLGFWSEHKPALSPRKRSFSQHITSAIPQPGELFTGLLDTLAQKMPGAAASKSSSSSSSTAAHDALLSNSTYTDGYDDDKTALGSPAANGKHAVPERSYSQPPLTGGPAKFSSQLTIDPCVVGSSTGGSSSGGFGRRVAPGLSSPAAHAQHPQQQPYDPDELAFSPKSDTLLSPQSLGSPTSPRPLARFDSTDQFLLTLSERDRTWLEEDERAAASSDPALSVTRRSSGDEPLVIFTERWADKERRIQATSAFGALPGWRLLPVIVKSNDDLRQEQLAAQLIRQFAKVFDEGQVPVFLRPYDVIAISPTAGLVEAIADTISIDSLKRNDRAFTTLLDFFERHFGDASTPEFRKARTNFVRSMAGYAIVCYLLQVKDRHNGNLLVDAEGHIIHIDFGYILSNNPGNMAFEQAPFKLTSDFVALMGGPRSASFRQFRSLCVRAFLVARKYRHRFILLVEMMLSGNEHLPCFAGDPKGTVERLAARFQPDLDINACEDFVHSLIDASLDNWRTKWYDKYQRWCVGVF